MKTYFQKEDKNNITYHEFSLLCLRLAAETYGCPIFGPFNDRVLEFKKEELNKPRRNVLKSLKYVQIKEPSESERNQNSALAQVLLNLPQRA